MLRRLSIRNYILIDSLDADFQEGMSVITGETGAGKSILLGALGLILGQRADTQALLDKNRKCIVEAEFAAGAYRLERFFAEHELDFDDPVIIRREISPAGKSRAFVNDTPVALQVLKALGDRLVDIHSQHETLTAGDSRFQLELLDLIGGLEKETAEYRIRHAAYRDRLARLEALEAEDRKAKAEADYLRFQYDELQNADLRVDEQSALEDEVRLQAHAEDIAAGLGEAVQTLTGHDDSVVRRTEHLAALLTNLAAYQHRLGEAAGRLRSAAIELKDVAQELDILAGDIHFDPRRAREAGERLDELNRLLQKHRVSSVGELISLYHALDSRLQAGVRRESDLAALRDEIASSAADLRTRAGSLSKGRKAAGSRIEKAVQSLLAETGIANGRLRIRVTPLPDGALLASGGDRVAFDFSANKGVDFAPLNKVASGGELSRLMLCLKSLLAGHVSLPTLVFDEIDSGISGEIAFKVASILRRMAGRHQVLVITHLPQMASRGAHHYLVYKETGKTLPATRIRKLDADERIREIAQMIGGRKPSETAMKNAKEMLTKSD